MIDRLRTRPYTSHDIAQVTKRFKNHTEYARRAVVGLVKGVARLPGPQHLFNTTVVFLNEPLERLQHINPYAYMYMYVNICINTYSLKNHVRAQ